MCRSVLVGKAGSGFWEGGHGTRDKVKMSRKGKSHRTGEEECGKGKPLTDDGPIDPRKYKRRGGTTPGGTKK
jgi:hypothetical protein